MLTLLSIAALAFVPAFIAAVAYYDRRAIQKRQREESAAMLARIAELKAEADEYRKCHAKHSHIDRKIVLLTARSLKP